MAEPQVIHSRLSGATRSRSALLQRALRLALNTNQGCFGASSPGQTGIVVALGATQTIRRSRDRLRAVGDIDATVARATEPAAR
jgi:hypothetical protein